MPIAAQFPSPRADPVEVFVTRCEVNAYLLGKLPTMDPLDTVDAMQAVAVASGLVDKFGQDSVQAFLAAAFAFAFADDQEPDEPLPPKRAAQSTVEALLHCLRERGIAALRERKNLDRLAQLSTDQVGEVFHRLLRLRSDYPVIDDELIFILGEQIYAQ